MGPSGLISVSISHNTTKGENVQVATAIIVVAAIFLATISTALNAYGVGNNVYGIFRGCILVFAFSLYTIRLFAARKPANAKRLQVATAAIVALLVIAAVGLGIHSRGAKSADDGKLVFGWSVYDMSNPFYTFGFMYAEPAGMTGSEHDSFIYCGVNSHWEEQTLELPNLPEGVTWKTYLSSADYNHDAHEAITSDAITLAPRSLVVLVGEHS